jgi:hypothetical protein
MGCGEQSEVMAGKNCAMSKAGCKGGRSERKRERDTSRVNVITSFYWCSVSPLHAHSYLVLSLSATLYTTSGRTWTLRRMPEMKS